MKPLHIMGSPTMPGPAAFRRLCVETFWRVSEPHIIRPAAFRRLCVETILVMF